MKDRHSAGGMKNLIPTSWVIALLLISFTSLQLAVAATDPGWLSIDCGATESYEDNGIHWVPDTPYISGVGSTATVKVPLNSSHPLYTKQLTTLRYFPDITRTRYCYTIPTNRSQPYLLRWSFYHGGYDYNRSEFLVFYSFGNSDIIIGIGSANVTELEVVYDEGIFRTSEDNVHLCLYRMLPTETPFISSLELRPLDSKMYKAVIDDTFLVGSFRLDFGAPQDSLLRYPKDGYDRYWIGAADTSYRNVRSIINSNYENNLGFAGDLPPREVMNTALTSVDDNSPMELNLPYPLSWVNTSVLINLYFAELQYNISKGERVFDIIVNGAVQESNFDVLDRTQNLYTPVEISPTNCSIQLSPQGDEGILNVTLAKTSTSKLRANAIEVFVVHNNIPGTLPTDASAIERMKAAFQVLVSWTGDPCLATPFDWLNCTTTTPPRITAVKLSNSNLTGTIPEALKNLTSLTSLYLDNNKLTGPIPVWLVDLVELPSLRDLYLQNNSLSGNVPEYNKGVLNLRIEGNPNLCLSNATYTCPTIGNASVAYIAVGVVVGAILAIAAGVTLYCLCSAKKKQRQSLQTASTDEFQGAGTAAARGSRFTLAQVMAATKNHEIILGRGGFGPVYYGKLASGQEVAVKVASKGSSQGSKEFINEIELLTRIHHRNLVSLVGYCDESDNLMLLYEFMPLGTLQEHLYGVVKTERELFLAWKTRLQIALGAAQGLEYLHEGCNPAIFHRDVKSNNILLGDKLTPKVADFGLSKSTNSNESVTHVSTQVKGTFGYLDPEYFITNQLTDKSDVYGFGIVLLELICARPPFVPSLPEEERGINHWVKPSFQSGEIIRIVDPALAGHYNIDCMLKVANLAMMSLQPRGVHRPNMSTVVHQLRESLQMENGSDSSSNIPPALQHSPRADFTFDTIPHSIDSNSKVQFSSDSAAIV